MATIEEAVALAIRHHQAGELAQAEQLCRQVLQANPQHVIALHLLGVLAFQAGQPEQSVTYIRQALAQEPGRWPCHFSLGMAYHKLGRREEAAACYRQVVVLRPDFPEAHNNLGILFQHKGKLPEALACFQQAVALKPGYAEAHNNRGAVLLELGRSEEAAACFQQALTLQPTYVEAHNNLGNALQSQGRLEASIACYQQALMLNPDFAGAHSNLGNTFLDQGRLEEAEACYRQALKLKPDFAEAYSNLGLTLMTQGQLDEAAGYLQEALRLKPDYPDAHLSRAILRLRQGNFVEGWPEYDWRWRTKQMTAPSFAQPRWDGSELLGRTILLYAEQGLGDTIQFIRYAPLVKQRGGRVIVACQERLSRLLASCDGVDQLMALGTPMPRFDVQAPLMSLPAILGTTMQTVPAPVSYLRANPERIEVWRERLGHKPGLKVGINWRGRPNNPMERHRGMALESFAALARLEGVRLISLQRGPGTEEVHQVADRFRVEVLANELDEEAGPFQDTAAIMKNLDLVITSDTVIPHVAGALGVPVWVALPYVADWRWLVDREDCPWYPTMRLFRQSQPGQWQQVFHRMAQALQERLASSAGPAAGAQHAPHQSN